MKDMNTWSAMALNTAPDSQNRIHSDELAKEYGFEGGLVPGVTISAYLVHPLIELWGKEWLDSGFANCRITSPLYDEELFEVKSNIVDETHAHTTLIRSNGVVSANAEIAITKNLPKPPISRADNLVEEDFTPPLATKEVWNELKSRGCKAFKFTWGDEDPLIYLRDASDLPDLLQPREGGFSNLSFLLGCSNWALSGNAYMNPWVHVQTISQNYRAVSYGTPLIAEMQVNSVFERKSHEFVDVGVNLFGVEDEKCVMTINLIAIYRLRGS